MRRRFVVAVEGMTPDEEQKFMEFAKEQHGLGWWHWIDNFWLLTGKSDDVTVDNLRAGLARITGRKRCLVMEFPEDITWAGLGPSGNDGEKNMFKWLHDTWSRS